MGRRDLASSSAATLVCTGGLGVAPGDLPATRSWASVQPLAGVEARRQSVDRRHPASGAMTHRTRGPAPADRRGGLVHGARHHDALRLVAPGQVGVYEGLVRRPHAPVADDVGHGLAPDPRRARMPCRAPRHPRHRRSRRSVASVWTFFRICTARSGSCPVRHSVALAHVHQAAPAATAVKAAVAIRGQVGQHRRRP